MERIQTVMQTQSGPFELVLINDASPDDTWQVIRDLCQRYSNMLGLDLLCNVGQVRATICGFEHARGEFVITLDDDFQRLPEDIPKLIDAMRADASLDCIIGGFRDKKHGRLIRDWGNALLRRVNTTLYGCSPTLKMTAFRMMKRPVVSAICAHRTTQLPLSAMLLQSTHHIANVEVDHQARKRGVSGYTVVQLIWVVWDNIVNASTLPLRLVSFLGIVITSISGMIGLYFLLQFGIDAIGVDGPTTLAVLIMFVGGLTLFSIGLLGEYITRILREVVSAPRYQLREQVGAVEEEEGQSASSDPYGK